MGQRKCAAAFLLAEEMYQIPATKSVILARPRKKEGCISALPGNGERSCLNIPSVLSTLLNNGTLHSVIHLRHEDRIRQHEQASDLQYIHKHINDVYTRMGLKDDGVFNTA